MKAMLFDIQRNSFVDGPGIRTTVFFKGCNLRCQWCHNPESQSRRPQMLLYKDSCTGCGACARVCPNPKACTLCGKCTLYCPSGARMLSGKEWTVEEVMAEILKDQPYFTNSGGGVTFSGGECMLQIDFLTELLKRCKEAGIHTTVDTAGHVPFSSFQRVLPHTDLFLYDIKLLDAAAHKIHTGVDNAQILENYQKLLAAKANVWVRIPVIPGVNDSEGEMERIKAFLGRCGRPQRVELLPYHAMGEHKHCAIGQTPQRFPAPTEEKMAQLRVLFSEAASKAL